MATGLLAERYEYTPYGQRTIYRHGWLRCDFDGDGDVDGNDYLAFQSDYRSSLAGWGGREDAVQQVHQVLGGIVADGAVVQAVLLDGDRVETLHRADPEGSAVAADPAIGRQLAGVGVGDGDADGAVGPVDDEVAGPSA